MQRRGEPRVRQCLQEHCLLRTGSIWTCGPVGCPWKNHTQEEGCAKESHPIAQPHSPRVKCQQHVLIKQNLFRSICSVAGSMLAHFCSSTSDMKEGKRPCRQSPVTTDSAPESCFLSSAPTQSSSEQSRQVASFIQCRKYNLKLHDNFSSQISVQDTSLGFQTAHF